MFSETGESFTLSINSYWKMRLFKMRNCGLSSILSLVFTNLEKFVFVASFMKLAASLASSLI